MKNFNLQNALNGKPVILRNGAKAYVKYMLDNCWYTQGKEGYALSLCGYIVRKHNYPFFWNEKGSAYDDSLDIIGMWHESLNKNEIIKDLIRSENEVDEAIKKRDFLFDKYLSDIQSNNIGDEIDLILDCKMKIKNISIYDIDSLNNKITVKYTIESSIGDTIIYFKNI